MICSKLIAKKNISVPVIRSNNDCSCLYDIAISVVKNNITIFANFRNFKFKILILLKGYLCATFMNKKAWSPLKAP